MQLFWTTTGLLTLPLPLLIASALALGKQDREIFPINALDS
jgi:hypothetical protein